MKSVKMNRVETGQGCIAAPENPGRGRAFPDVREDGFNCDYYQNSGKKSKSAAELF
ncbi:MAG: hypothetical protein IJG60_06280 [Thermoguttaceae bacterium]|nr:hypothetical protein [Thermoguttaceae bacterium]